MAVPVITSITPSGGSADGGTTVTIVGTSLGTPTGVTFGSTPATSFAGESATRAYAIAPAGTGTVHVTLTTAGGTSAAGTDFTYGDALFTVAEARAFDKAQLTSATDYPDLTIADKETEIHEFLHKVCGVWFCPVTTTNEYHDGDGSTTMMLDEALVTSITAASYRSSGTSTWTALTASELALLQVSDTGLIYRDGSTWTKGVRNWKLTYVSGHTVVPEQVKTAALQIAVTELPATNVGFGANSYSEQGVEYSFNLGDGYGENWHRIPEVRRAIRLYSHRVPGIA